VRKYSILLLILVLGLSLSVSCRQKEPLAPEEPYAVLLTPGEGSTISAGDIEVRIFLQNFTITENSGVPNEPNQGHIIYYLDVEAPRTYGAPATTAPGTYAISAGTSFIWKNVPVGDHTFTVQLVNNDDTPLLPPTAVRANVTVRAR
jgi:hypothetical protein